MFEFIKKMFTNNEPHKAYVFFNCDENKSQESMNIQYNHAIYGDELESRMNLWDKVQEEFNNNRIYFEPTDALYIEREIMFGDPTAVSKYIKFGNIVSLDLY